MLIWTASNGNEDYVNRPGSTAFKQYLIRQLNAKYFHTSSSILDHGCHCEPILGRVLWHCQVVRAIQEVWVCFIEGFPNYTTISTREASRRATYPSFKRNN